MNFFDQDSPYLNHPLLTPERTRAEVDQLHDVLGLEPGDHVLDVGCAFGRHTIELAARGIHCLGIDPSKTMIVAAEERATKATFGTPIRPQFKHLRAQDLHEQDRFDHAFCLFTTLGQIDRDGKTNESLLINVAKALKPGGQIAVDVPNRAWVQANLRTSDVFGEGANRTEVRRSVDATTNRASERFDVYANSELRQFDLGYYLYTPDELTKALHRSGFDDVRQFQGLDAAAATATPVGAATGPNDQTPIGDEDQTIVVVARVA